MPAALIRRMHEAKLKGALSVTIWGTGTPRKLVDTTKLKALGWQAKTALREGLARAYENFRKNHA